MSKNIEEYVVCEVIKHLESSNNECAMLKYMFKHQYLNCVLCNKILVPVDHKDKKYENAWICPCDFCFIEDSYPAYDYAYHHTFRSRGLGEPICGFVYCKECVTKEGYNNLFCRYDLEKKEYDFEFTANNFHRPDIDRKLNTWKNEPSKYINMCKKCYKEDN